MNDRRGPRRRTASPAGSERLVAGPRAVTEALRSGSTISQVLIDEAQNRTDLMKIASVAEEQGVCVSRVPKRKLDRLAGDVRHQGVLAQLAEYAYADLADILRVDKPLIVALDQITDPHNFGAIVRSAVAFGAAGIVTLKDRAAPVTPTVVRSSAGATEHAKIVRVTNLARTLRSLREDGLQIVGLAGESDTDLTHLGAVDTGRVIVVGSEGKGLRRLVREACDPLVRIEIRGPVESLNASVAAGIALHHCTR